jgi:hypothetical protein
MIKTAKVVTFFTITTGKQIQYQVVKKFIDIHILSAKETNNGAIIIKIGV